MLIAFFTGSVFSSSTNIDSGSNKKNPPTAAVTPVSPSPDGLPYADSVSLNTIIVTAARRPQATQWVPDDHQIIDISKEEKNSSKKAVELLAERLPARFSDIGGGNLKNISLRGAGAERTLVLVDGQRIGTGDQALQDLGDFPDEAIERIEVVEGGQSALYGMDAVGGVVNIITKKPQSEKISVNISSMVGSYEPRSDAPALNNIGITGTIGQKKGPLGWLFGADTRMGDGRFEYEEPNNNLYYRENDSLFDGGFFGRLDYTRKQYSLGVNGGFRKRNCGTPGPTSWPLDASTSKNIGFAALSGSWKATPFLSLAANGAFDYNGVQYLDRTIYAWDSIPDTSTNNWATQSAEILGTYTIAGQNLTAGVCGFRKSVTSNMIIADDTSALQGGAYTSAILGHTIAGFTVNATPAARFDYNPVFGSAWTGKCGVISVWNGLLRPGLFFTIAKSFRSPTLSDLYWKDPYMVGNPQLKPEKGWNWDVGGQMRHRSGPIVLTARAGMYQMSIRDMLAWITDTLTGVSYRKNIKAAVIKGYTFKSAVSVLNKYTTSFDFVYNDARDTATKKVLTYRPEYMVTYSNSLDLGRFCAGIAARYVSKVYTNADNTTSLPVTLILNANVGCSITPGGSGSNGVRLVYDVLNLTNERYYTDKGFPLPGREHRLGVKVGF